jgi:hypothetical protein
MHVFTKVHNVCPLLGSAGRGQSAAEGTAARVFRSYGEGWSSLAACVLGHMHALSPPVEAQERANEERAVVSPVTARRTVIFLISSWILEVEGWG